MAQTTEPILVRKNIRVLKDVHLIFDKERDFYRIAVYRPKKDGETDIVIDKELWESMTRAGMLPKKPREFWYRVAGTSRNLKGGIELALKEARITVDLDTLFHYIASTEWRNEL